MITLEVAHRNIGAKVRYIAPQSPETKAREGVITSANDSFIFVRYVWQHATASGIGCYPRDLVFINYEHEIESEMVGR